MGSDLTVCHRAAQVFPGETISVEIWRDGDVVSFRACVRARQAKVPDNGMARLRTVRASADKQLF